MSSNHIVDAELLRRIQALELKAREVADGVLLGIHHAPNRGRSIEFAEHKEYSPGDDIRRIDWKVFGKSDRYYVKEYEDDTNITAVVLVDGSRSMTYRSERGRDTEGKPLPTKLDHARVLASALCYLLLTQSDSVGVGVVGNGLEDFLPARARQAHFYEAVRKLAAIEPCRGTNISEALAGLAPLLKGRALVIIFSDLLDEPERMMKAINLLRSRHNELVVFHVLDPDEIEFPFERLSFFKDMEGPDRLLVDPRTIREEYLRHFSAFMEDVKRECAGRGIDYRLARTDEPPARLLSSWLSFRASSSGMRGGR